jgi:hypothetical protein
MFFVEQSNQILASDFVFGGKLIISYTDLISFTDRNPDMCIYFSQFSSNAAECWFREGHVWEPQGFSNI